MEIKYKLCDRCGKELNYIGWTSLIRKSRFRITYLFSGNRSGYEYLDQYIELCAECTKELEKFLTAAKKKRKDG